MASAMFVRGPKASIEISPGWALTMSAMKVAAGVSTATPCITYLRGWRGCTILPSHVEIQSGAHADHLNLSGHLWRFE